MRRSDIVHPDDRGSDAAVVRRVRNREVEVGSLEPAAPGIPAGRIGVLDKVGAKNLGRGRQGTPGA